MLHSMVDICMWTRSSSLHTVCITGARSVHLRLLLESRSCFSSFSWKWETAEISASCNTKHIDHTRHDMNNNRYGLPIIKANSANQCTTNILCHKRCPYQLPWNEVSCINVNAKINKIIVQFTMVKSLGAYTLLGRAKSLGRYALSGRANSLSKCALLWRAKSFSKYALMGKAKTSKTKSLG